MLNPLEKYYLDRYPRIIEILKSKLSESYYYHSIRHTLDVIECTQAIGMHEGLGEEELATLKIAALYHDIGFITQRHQHEEASAQFFLQDVGEDLSNDQISQIVSLILATQMPQRPKNKLECIICDADLDYLGRSDFSAIAEDLYKEMLFCNEINSPKSWNKLQIQFLEKHHFHTSYSRLFKESIKQENLRQLIKLSSDSQS